MRELLALAEKRYRDADHASQPEPFRNWLQWVSPGARDDLRLASTVFLAGPVLVADYLTRVGHGWLAARNIEPEEPAEPGPPAVELFPGGARSARCACSTSVLPVENYCFLASVFDDFDLTSESFGLSHAFDHAWLSRPSAPAQAESKQESPAKGGPGRPEAAPGSASAP